MRWTVDRSAKIFLSLTCCELLDHVFMIHSALRMLTDQSVSSAPFSISSHQKVSLWRLEYAWKNLSVWLSLGQDAMTTRQKRDVLNSYNFLHLPGTPLHLYTLLAMQAICCCSRIFINVSAVCACVLTN